MKSVFLVVLIGFGCVKDRTGQSIISAMKTDIQISKERIEHIEKEIGRINARVGDLESLTRSRGKSDIMKMESIDELRMEVANLRNDIEVLNRDYSKTSKDVLNLGEDSQFRLLWLENRAKQLEDLLGFSTPNPPGQDPAPAAPSSEESDNQEAGGTIAPEASPKSSDPQPKEQASKDPQPAGENKDDPSRLLALAADHLRGDRAKAAETVLNQLLKNYPKHVKAVEAKYRLAEAAYNSKQFKLAANRFQAVIDHSNKGYWAPWAMLRQGECFEQLKRPKSARYFYEDVIRNYPASDAAKDAQVKLSAPPFKQ